MAKNLASELVMSHVDQMATGEQDGAAQQARNVDSDGQYMMMVSICKGMYCMIGIEGTAGIVATLLRGYWQVADVKNDTRKLCHW